MVLGHGGGSEVGRLLANPLASQTRVDVGDTDNVRQIHKELRFCWFTFSCLLSHPLPSSLLSWDFWLGYCGCTYLEMPVGGQTAKLMGRGEEREREGDAQEKGIGQAEQTGSG